MENPPITSEQARELAIKYLGGDLVDLLTAPTPKEWKRNRKIRGGGRVDYIPGAFFTQRLNEVFGFLWSYEVVEAFEKDGQLIGKGRLTIKVPGRSVTIKHPDGIEETYRTDGIEVVKEQYGGSDIKTYAQDIVGKGGGPPQHRKGEPIDIGDDYKAMATDAKKKCGTELGMFHDVYGPGMADEEEKEGKVRGSQLSVLWMRGEAAGMDEAATRKWAEEKLGKALEDCDQEPVLDLIPQLMEMAKRLVPGDTG